MLNEGIYLIRGRNEGRPVWRYILAKAKKSAPLKSLVGTNIDTNEIGRDIQYRDQLGRVEKACGLGANPPKHLKKWLGDRYGKKRLHSLLFARSPSAFPIY